MNMILGFTVSKQQCNKLGLIILIDTAYQNMKLLDDKPILIWIMLTSVHCVSISMRAPSAPIPVLASSVTVLDSPRESHCCRLERNVKLNKTRLGGSEGFT